MHYCTEKKHLKYFKSINRLVHSATCFTSHRNQLEYNGSQGANGTILSPLPLWILACHSNKHHPISLKFSDFNFIPWIHNLTKENFHRLPGRSRDHSFVGSTSTETDVLHIKILAFQMSFCFVFLIATRFQETLWPQIDSFSQALTKKTKICKVLC